MPRSSKGAIVNAYSVVSPVLLPLGLHSTQRSSYYASGEIKVFLMSWKKTQKKSWEMFLGIKVTCTIHTHLKFASCALTESLHVVDKFVTFLWQSNLWARAQRSVHDTGEMSYCQLSLHSVLKENKIIKCIRTLNQKSTRLSTNQTCLQTSFFPMCLAFVTLSGHLCFVLSG